MNKPNPWQRKLPAPTPKNVHAFVLTLSAAALLIFCFLGIWLWLNTQAIKRELTTASTLLPQLQQEVESRDPSATATIDEITSHTAAAATLARNPLWLFAGSIPAVGPNVRAITEVAVAADDVASLGAKPVVEAARDLKLEDLAPKEGAINLPKLQSASLPLASGALAIASSADRINQIDTSALLEQVAAPVQSIQTNLNALKEKLHGVADASTIFPSMLGADGRRSYLVMIQNLAEARASGGIPGAIVELTFDSGQLSLGDQSSAADIGTMTPALHVDPQQQQIYSTRLGKYMQDVNLTPDFPTAATTAQAMWQKKTGHRVDGVISIDPMVLSYILQSTGPVAVKGPELAAVKVAGLPTELTGNNVVSTLLSDVYAKIQQPKLQDAYFAGVAKEIFAALSSGKGEAKGLITGITRGTEEGRVLLWSADVSEQSVISKYPLSGSVSGPSILPAQFGLYFNDGTGAKMDYYVKRTVQLVKECPADGYEQTMVRVTSTNTAPADAAASLPAYVTGGGNFGVAPGTVQTNIVAYGPAQANVESATVDGQKTPFAPYLHANRPVGVIAQQLAPGESKSVEFTFGKIIQHTEPNLVVTPTVQPVKDVILPTQNASC